MSNHILLSNNFRGEIEPGDPLHDMWIRLTVDSEFIVQDVEVHTDAGPYQLCPSILPNFQKLKGLKIGPGWNRRVRETSVACMVVPTS